MGSISLICCDFHGKVLKIWQKDESKRVKLGLPFFPLLSQSHIAEKLHFWASGSEAADLELSQNLGSLAVIGLDTVSD